jgi:hypothetical protein
MPERASIGETNRGRCSRTIGARRLREPSRPENPIESSGAPLLLAAAPRPAASAPSRPGVLTVPRVRCPRGRERAYQLMLTSLVQFAHSSSSRLSAAFPQKQLCARPDQTHEKPAVARCSAQNRSVGAPAFASRRQPGDRWAGPRLRPSSSAGITSGDRAVEHLCVEARPPRRRTADPALARDTAILRGAGRGSQPNVTRPRNQMGARSCPRGWAGRLRRRLPGRW